MAITIAGFLREVAVMKMNKPDKRPGADVDQLLRIIDVQNRVIDSLAMAITTLKENNDEDEDDKAHEDEEET